MFESVLVANRGEIAVRVIRTLRRLGVRSIAVYSDADADAPHVRLADVAVRLGAGPAGDSYLSIERVLEALAATDARAVHPGYGFLSENADFARACAAAGVVFVGPPPEAIELLGDKVAAKRVAEQAGVPVLAGLQREDLDDEAILQFAREQPARLPLMVKATAGGGGRGMRIVRTLQELPQALAAARREAHAGFGDDSIFVERYVERARHIEVQLLADAHGTVLHLGERECSLQRRHQKVVEECPSPAVSPELRAQLGEASISLARAAGYVGAGTAEFILSADDMHEWFFLEVNARLQVEHPVTELATGLDLVEQQLIVASGAALQLTQSDVQISGHAIEARLCAEDPANDFLPSTGTLIGYREPAGDGVRVDSGVAEGSEITSHYDSLLAKLIVSGADRPEALGRLDEALARLRLLGLRTNAGFLRRLMLDEEVRQGRLDTGLIERTADAIAPPHAARRSAAVAVSSIELLQLHDRASERDPWDSLVGFRLDGAAPVTWELQSLDTDESLLVSIAGSPSGARATVDGEAVEVVARSLGRGRVAIALDGTAHDFEHATDGEQRWVADGPDAFAFRLVEPVSEHTEVAAAGSLEAPMPGTVLDVRVACGDTVCEGDVLVVMESMKMELTLVAPTDAVVLDALVAQGDGVKQGQRLVELEAVA
ncbi:MAG TPA: biotin carboxylase N-terminal domain-containing protein [Solirubrobacteraceae bacterium]|jgi:acetyl-CoA/propionyl-CoA carboxylase biotin carboxyl carrier protein|nr:biotin carboxylase N-terminal domain-containing protein [Solirubrobacteraceae bacterium]